jgi:hypothetical protein
MANGAAFRQQMDNQFRVAGFLRLRQKPLGCRLNTT